MDFKPSANFDSSVTVTIADTITFEGASPSSELLPPTNSSEPGLWLLFVLVLQSNAVVTHLIIYLIFRKLCSKLHIRFSSDARSFVLFLSLSANAETFQGIHRKLTESVSLFSLSIGKCWIIRRRRGVSFKASAYSHFWTSDTAATVLKICETWGAPNVVRLVNFHTTPIAT
jgi:hypothetical protein